jgi:vacuolar-type H+-ATPase subunit H
MRDVIQSILATEAEAKQIVATARTEAARLLATAQREAEAASALAKARTDAEIAQWLTTAAAAAQRRKDEELTRARAEIAPQIRITPALHQQAVAAVVRCVVGGNAAAGKSS